MGGCPAGPAAQMNGLLAVVLVGFVAWAPGIRRGELVLLALAGMALGPGRAA